MSIDDFNRVARKLEEKFLEKKVRNMTPEKRERYLENYAILHYFTKEYTFMDYLANVYNGKKFSVN